MTLFWIITAGLIVLAMAFVALPLLRKHVETGVTTNELNLSVFKQQLAELDADLEVGILEQNCYDAARKDLEKELLTDISSERTTTETAVSGRNMALSALLIPLVAVFLYQTIGSPEIIQHLAEQPGGMPTKASLQQSQPGNTQNLPPMGELVKRLAAKMQEQPDNQEGWVMLGRSYIAMNNSSAAINAYERAIQLNDQNVALLLAYSEAIASTNGNDFSGRAAPMIDKAYQLEPNNPNVLWISGILAYQRSEFKSAIERWEALKVTLQPQSAKLEPVNDALDDVRSKLALAPDEGSLPTIVQAKKPDSSKPVTDSSKSLQVEISLSPELQAKAKAGDLVFVYAKALSGPPMPLAAVRKKVSDLPLSIELDDSMAMIPQMKLSGFPEVIVGARVSLSANPSAQNGDLEGEIKPVSPGQSETVRVVINSIHP
ncbi:MAG: c-type cytochrome biogenesis protein CcmI [Candidatus Thiodiazotropha sp. (ex Lucinoma aequizonata)]|nr:c-type cytochrome biogenesis protein CcmI [Candidatus Thiodiazotropha sp. (ex Lucinoma aequizonata)]MCU7890021.1 c-type cytochrome biogenesis protein CcmI [Candidatus Thiodiazotropha sp. (ex Lucinoma aequizonata)]MCU7896338.1 c-type cytochrome biogenesis protein CcmI [Candidatus Thiodiazotropha sp. (ex Lucinoma aequizonata)]MCU7899477.1 c-type cytochrome biogenesis protein CcmI [Candidatus Thiodiazotropha sp. (ex Lucinoma aequizonata)]MCU7901980.1 c-type cytochrome biogenesis protein CcmI [C